MRRLLAALRWIRPSAHRESASADGESERGFTLGGPYFVETAKGMEGPFWPRILGPSPKGYLPEPVDSDITFGDDASETMLAWLGLSRNAKGQADNS